MAAMEQQDWIDWIGDGIDDVRGQEQPDAITASVSCA